VRDFVTTLLDATGLLLLAAGVAGGAWPFVGAWALSLGWGCGARGLLARGTGR
jgi:hypothetical protein